MGNNIRVLIVDDSPLVQGMLKNILESDSDIEIIGIAKDGKEAVEKARLLKPNVITMDIRMPVMSGHDAIRKIMEEAPIPIIVVSCTDAAVIKEALDIGAMDFVVIPSEIGQISKELIEKVKVASKVNPLKRLKTEKTLILRPALKKHPFKVIAIGVSTGGPQALGAVISRLPADFPAGILIVQHMTKGFIDGLAEWLRFSSSLDIRVAKAGETLKSGMVLFAPDDLNVKIDAEGKIILSENSVKNMFHTPSIDVMMESVAFAYGQDAIGVIMTGMGQDGVKGMLAIKESGGKTIAQDESTSAIFGMNKIAIETGCIDKVAPVDKISEEIIKML